MAEQPPTTPVAAPPYSHPTDSSAAAPPAAQPRPAAAAPTASAKDSSSSSWLSPSSYSAYFTWGTHNRTSSTAAGDPSVVASSSSAATPSWYPVPWYQAADSFNHAAEASYAAITDAVSSFYKDSSSPLSSGGSETGPGGGLGPRSHSWSSDDSPLWLDQQYSSTPNSLILSLQRQQGRRQRRRSKIQSRTPPPDFDSLASTLFHNPYQSVRGRHYSHRQSMSAIRSFISLVPDVNDPAYHQDDSSFRDDEGVFLGEGGTIQPPQFMQAVPPQTTEAPLETVHERQQDASRHQPPAPEYAHEASSTAATERSKQEQPPPLQQAVVEEAPPRHQASAELSSSFLSNPGDREMVFSRADATAETAAHLAEGTMRAWRDLALEEAVELNAALRFWSDRWEQPGLSFLEAGPQVWMSEGGYSHRQVGKRVAQIQAVLARRCAAIGEVQQHLLRAGWQKGVAQWGVLGQGGHWATVAGFDGSMQPDTVQEHQPAATATPATEPTMQSFRNFPPSSPLTRQLSDAAMKVANSARMAAADEKGDVKEDSHHGSTTGAAIETDDRMVGGLSTSHDNLQRMESARDGGMADVFVRKRDGGGTFVDDPAFLARWSVEAMALVRRQMFRASNGTVPLPFAANWVTDGSFHGHNVSSHHEDETNDKHDDEEGGNVILGPAEPSTDSRPRMTLPLWAIDAGLPRQSGNEEGSSSQQQRVLIADLPSLTTEVSELLDVMEDIMDLQRQRRLSRLQPPSWWRRNWYMVATSVPLAIYLVRHGYLRFLASSLVRSIKFFFVERIQGPMLAIFDELWKGRASFSDKKAHKEAIEVLKKMIKSWLDDSYPDMPDKERQRLANAMDVSLVEQKKEESMKTLGFNTFDVVRMSFIEMQWLKKEMMNALDAMDEVMSANDINMNLAAITPVVLLVYVQSRVIRYLFYALLRLGKSRDETYASFRAILMDIERLLVMRDNPPDSAQVSRATPPLPSPPCVLGPDDLGMLMLLIHECRTILWRERRRFSPSMIRSVSEDLSELAGERGAVSVKQQLQIVSRMTRSYPFLKVISTGHFFNNQLRRE